jgi:hypothetical protein
MVERPITARQRGAFYNNHADERSKIAGYGLMAKGFGAGFKGGGECPEGGKARGTCPRTPCVFSFPPGSAPAFQVFWITMFGNLLL